METANPYQTPEGDLQQPGDDTPAEVKIFSPSGRIGRLRYLAYATASILISYAIMAVPLLMVMQSGGSTGWAAVFGVVYGITAIVGAVLGVFWMIKRLHDLDKSGWLALLILIPLANVILLLYMLIASGTPTANRFGPPPVPNTTGVKVLAALFPVMIVLVGVVSMTLSSFMQGLQ